jgi:hypothetical protein
MSVLVLDLPIFNYLIAGVEKAAYNRTVDEFYFYCIGSHFQHRDIETEALRLVKSWANMNEKSYCLKYKQDGNSLSEFIKPTFTHKPLEILQFIKYLQCLVYNIELTEFTPEEENDYKLLKRLLNDAMSAYIGSLEAYKQANWSN